MKASLSLLGFGAALVACACSSAPPQASPGRVHDVVIEAPAAARPPTQASIVAEPPAPLDDKSRLLLDPSFDPGPAPETFRARFDTTAGPFDIECVRAWAPHGADRLHHLLRIGFFEDQAVFRVITRPRPFIVQFGIHGHPEVAHAWKDAQLPVDPVKQSNTRGTLTFAMAGSPTTRTTQLFINLADNTALDEMGFSPVCQVIEPGIEVVEAFFAGYGEDASRQQGRIQERGNPFLREEFPQLDYIRRAGLFEP